MLKIARVAAVALSLGMLVWFVSRSSGGSDGAAPESGAGGASGTNAAGPGLEVSQPAIATSSKSIGQPIFTTKGNGDGPIVMPGSKSVSFDVISKAEPGKAPAGNDAAASSEAKGSPGVPTMAPSSKSAVIFVDEKGEKPAVNAAPSPAPTAIQLYPKPNAGEPVLAPSSKIGRVFREGIKLALTPEGTPAPTATPSPTP